jgi:GNAT superfamily N-acetyltransferase
VSIVAEHEALRRSQGISLAAARSIMATQVAELDGATALRVPEAPASPMLNRIVELGVAAPATEAQLDAAIAAMAGLRYYVTLSPAARPAEIQAWLIGRGFEPGWSWMQFRRGVDDLPDARTTLELVEIGSDRAGEFARIVRDAYALPATIDPVVAAAVGSDGWTCWLALAGDEPAGAAALFVHDGAGYLGYASTAAGHRGKGAQSALLAARIGRARELGCDAVFTETGEKRPDRPSNSYRNIMRAGFEELGVVTNWLGPPAAVRRPSP